MGVNSDGHNVGRFSTEGDSGALLVDVKTGCPAGMLIGANNTFSFGTALQPVLDHFQVDLSPD